MLALCSLHSLYQKQRENSSVVFERTVAEFLLSPSIPLPEDIIEECVWQEPLLSEEVSLQNWKRLLAFNLLCELSSSHQKEMSAKVRLFGRHPWNQSSQYFRSLVAINHAFAKMPVPEVGAHLLESGAALIDLHEYCPWLSLPYHPQHVEFGLFISLLALLTKRQDLQEIVSQLARWQLNTLDASARPLNGLFVREKEGKSFQHLCLSYLLFRSAASLTGEPSFAAAANGALQGIRELYEKKESRIEPLWALIEKWLERFKSAPAAHRIDRTYLRSLDRSCRIPLSRAARRVLFAWRAYRTWGIALRRDRYCQLWASILALGGVPRLWN